MIVIFIFIIIVVGLNCIPFVTNTNFPRIEKIFVGILTILFLIFAIFEFSSFKLKGDYTLRIIWLMFIGFSLFYFVLFKNTKKKIFIVVILTLLIPIAIFSLQLEILKEFIVDNSTKIVVTAPGLFDCEETINIIQTKFGIFDKKVYSDNTYLSGIEKIEIVKVTNKDIELLIYHDEKGSSRNPEEYKVERKGW